LSDSYYFSRLTSQKEQSLFKAVELLNKWLNELLLNGVSTLQDDPEKIMEISTRMVDMGLPGIARKLRLIPEKIKQSTDWTEYVYLQLGEFYLFTKSFTCLEQMDELEKEDLLSYAGIVFKKTDFVDENMLQDEWLYLGHQKEKEEKLVVKRNWFYGIHSNHTILFLEFQFNKFVKFKPLTIGNTYRSAVRFFPSKVYQRVKDISIDQIVKADYSAIKKINLTELLDMYCNAVSLNPFIKHQCFLLHEVKIARQSGRWFFTNEENQLVAIVNETDNIPKILTYAVEKESVYVCEYWNNGLKVISILIGSLVVEM
jgi:hypothetical protein